MCPSLLYKMQSRKINIILTAIILLLSACENTNYKQTYARITERREIGNDKLQLNYIFKVGQTIIVGSKQVDNQSVLSDSIKIRYNVENPLENQLLIKK